MERGKGMEELGIAGKRERNLSIEFISEIEDRIPTFNFAINFRDTSKFETRTDDCAEYRANLIIEAHKRFSS